MGIAAGAGCLVAALVLGPIALADNLPVPPIPPSEPPAGDAAPVPNIDFRGPSATAGEQPSVSLRLYRARPYDPGLGFAPGSRYQSTEDRKPIQTPGLSFSVPLK